MEEKTPFNFEFNPNGISADSEENERFTFGYDEDGLPLQYQEELFPDAEPRNEYEPLDPEKMPDTSKLSVKHDSPEYAARPAIDRTRELFSYMHPHRMTLLGILKATREPKKSTDMEGIVESLPNTKFTVYSAINLCTMLEKAGALERVTEDGTPYSDAKPEPEIVVVDGEEYYKPTDAVEVYWLCTDAGKTMIEEDDPVERMRSVLEHEHELAGIYKQVLLIARDGATMSTFSEKVDANPLISKPRRFFVQHFVESLERCEAVTWAKREWQITEVGEQILADLLSDVDAAEVFERTDRSKSVDNSVVPTETQGVNW